MKTQNQKDTKKREALDIHLVCPYCSSDVRQVKAGIHNGRQRYKCFACGHRYSLGGSTRGVGEEVREKARQMALDGRRTSEIAKDLGVSVQSVANWIKQSGIIRPARAEVACALSEASDTVKRKATISDVARLSGVSIASISNYLNKKSRLKDDTKKRIEEAIDQLHFIPNALMRGILKRRTRILGLMMFDLNNLSANVGTAVAPQILFGVSTAASERGHHILLYTGCAEDGYETSGEDFLGGTIDGMIWVAKKSPDPGLNLLESAGLPTIAVLNRRAPENVGFIDSDNFEGMKLLVTHLFELGHRRIAYIGSLHSPDFQDRAEGYRQALDALGIERDPQLEAVSNRFRNSWEEYAQTIDQWLALPHPPTAIMAQNDRCAGKIVEILAQRGLQAPKDIAVTGYDDVPDARWIAGGLTTVRQPFEAMGRQAVMSLIELIEGAPPSDCRKIMSAELIVRASTSCSRLAK